MQLHAITKTDFLLFSVLYFYFFRFNDGIILRQHIKMIQLVCQIFQTRILVLQNIVCKFLIFAACIYNEKLYIFFSEEMQSLEKIAGTRLM